VDEIRRLREKLEQLDEIDFSRLQARSFTGIPIMNYAFFPGGNGLYRGIEVMEFPKVRTIILGSDFACSTKHVDGENRLLIKKSDERNGATWTPMLDALAKTPIRRDECFFTNAWPFLHLPLKDGRASNDNPPIDLWRSDDTFMQRCIDYFRSTLKIVRPSLIVALGKGPALFLGEAWPDQLRDWRFPAECKLGGVSWKHLDRTFIGATEFDGLSLQCVAVNHPSKSRLNARHRSNGYKGLEGEIKLLNDAARSAGIVEK
jgi:hypothetical protein